MGRWTPKIAPGKTASERDWFSCTFLIFHLRSFSLFWEFGFVGRCCDYISRRMLLLASVLQPDLVTITIIHPESDIPVQPSTDEQSSAISAPKKVHSEHSLLVPLSSPQNLLTGHVPGDDVPIFTPTNHKCFLLILQVGADAATQPVFLIHMPLIRLDTRSAYIVPQPHTAIKCPRKDEFSIRREPDTHDWLSVLIDKCFETLSRACIPYPYQTISRTTHDHCAITEKIDATYRVTVCGQRAHDTACTNVPEEHGLVVGTGDEHVALGRECKG
jgi:hypothetical protein